MLLFLVRFNNSAWFEIYGVTRSSSSHPFLCALGYDCVYMHSMSFHLTFFMVIGGCLTWCDITLLLYQLAQACPHSVLHFLVLDYNTHISTHIWLCMHTQIGFLKPSVLQCWHWFIWAGAHRGYAGVGRNTLLQSGHPLPCWWSYWPGKKRWSKWVSDQRRPLPAQRDFLFQQITAKIVCMAELYFQGFLNVAKGSICPPLPESCPLPLGTHKHCVRCGNKQNTGVQRFGGLVP